MAPRNYYHGKKSGGRHATVIDAAGVLIRFLQEFPEVTRIIAGHISSGNKSSQRRIRIIEITGGLLVKVWSNGSVQRVIVYSRDVSATRKKLEDEY